MSRTQEEKRWRRNRSQRRGRRTSSRRPPQFTDEAEPDDVPAWEQIETGRYMPRRIRGSCRGRELG